MRKIACFSLIAISLIGKSIVLKKDLGLGIVAGDPTGITIKTWTGSSTSVCGASGWSFKEDYFQINCDFIYHFFDLIKVEKGELPLYLGMGGRILFKKEIEIGIRVPVGLTYLFEEAPFDLFFEISPLLNLYPETDFDASASIGGRVFLDL
ncbi:MAG: hypothetical protein ABIN61_03820 [candidate division WOR-3 bacterium]